MNLPICKTLNKFLVRLLITASIALPTFAENSVQCWYDGQYYPEGTIIDNLICNSEGLWTEQG